MKIKRNILLIFLLVVFPFIKQNYFSQVKLIYNVVEELRFPGKEIGGLWILKDTLILYDKIENKIYKINLLTKRTVDSLKLTNDNIIDISIDPLSEEAIAIDNNSNLLLGNYGKTGNYFSIKKNFNEFNSNEYLTGKVKKICVTKELYLVSTACGWSSGIYAITKSLDSIKFFSNRKGMTPAALVFDDKNIWSLAKKSPRGGGVLCRYNSIGVIDAYVETYIENPSYICYDGQYFWIADNIASKIIKVNVLGKEK